VLPEETVAAMNGILVQVPEWGTGRRAKLDGIRTAGKTGTTSAYRDAWFIGFTGNYTAAVWFGNDNYAPMRRLTGGVLPAQAWKQFMTFAHQGVQLKPIPLIENPFEQPVASEAVVAAGEPTDPIGGRAASLSDATSERLTIIEGLLRKAAGLAPLASLQRAPGAALTEIAGGN
jgi:penicillin-binding protein 1A